MALPICIIHATPRALVDIVPRNRICRFVPAEAVRDEVEENLLVRRGGLATAEANRVLDDYARLIALMKPEMAPYPGQGIDLNVEPKHEPVGAL